MLALKSMIGSTPQQFHTYLSHRGEETGNIRGSMRVRVPSERIGTRERLYGNFGVKVRCFLQPLVCIPERDFNLCVSEWISIDKDETGGPKGKPTIVSRLGHEYVKSVIF